MQEPTICRHAAAKYSGRTYMLSFHRYFAGGAVDLSAAPPAERPGARTSRRCRCASVCSVALSIGPGPANHAWLITPTSASRSYLSADTAHHLTTMTAGGRISSLRQTQAAAAAARRRCQETDARQRRLALGRRGRSWRYRQWHGTKSAASARPSRRRQKA